MSGSPDTLRKLIEAHPEWADLPIVVTRGDGESEWLSGTAQVFPHKVEERGEFVDVLAFSLN